MMLSQTFLSRALIVLCILAAVGPFRMVTGRLGARAAALRITEFGPFPEIPITWMDWLLGVCAVILLFAAAMELIHIALAAPLALLATTVLWIYFGPGIWAHVAADGFFEPLPGGYATSLPWQQCMFQIGATACAMWLTYSRYSLPNAF